MKKYYLVIVWGDVEPGIFGPFPTHIERDKYAKLVWKEEGDEHGLYPLDIVAEGVEEVEIVAYPGGFFD